VTLKTVETHLAHAYAKLGISQRSELPEALAGEDLRVHHWAVTGGTGAYHVARGTLTARDLSETKDELTIRLG
jgi:hypothetical protein